MPYNIFEYYQPFRRYSHSNIYGKGKGKGKEKSYYKPGVAQSVPGG